ncbi:hypothetical protein CTI12_AA133960 [Artemisia annua]|uniref:Zinc knuckle CX2CX4HX4C n=1 Tax=Artemisia annua TaxID=35608 RepID=A0A2U1PNB6_ARTAN|nr:hypothetical protein CTI12_AA133960 [Artemisia annua]
MDAMTATMCHEGKGRLGYATVLVEVDAKRGLAEEIEIAYRGNLGITGSRKLVRVVYDWKPPCCSHCGVFGHSTISCGKRPRTNEEKAAIELEKIKKDATQKTTDEEGFQVVDKNKTKANLKNKVTMQNEKTGYNTTKGKNGVGKGDNRKVHVEYRKKQNQTDVPSSSHTEGSESDAGNELEEENVKQDDIPGKDIVDKFVNLKVKPSKEDTSKWSPTMFKYFKECWKEMCEKNKLNNGEMELEDVLEDTTAAAQFMTADELSG